MIEKNIKIEPKILIKPIATILTIIMIFQLFPAIVFGVQKMNNQQGNNTIIQNNTNDDSTEIIGELVEKRTLNQKHFLQKDGNILTTIYPSNIHYEENGQLIDINNSLEEREEDNGVYQNKSNSFRVKFSKKSNKNNLIKIQSQNHNIKWSLQNSNKVNAVKITNKEEKEEKFKLKDISSGIVQYENILEGIDLQYSIISNTIKENIVIKNKKAIEQEIIFEYNTNNLKMQKAESGKIIFYEEGSDVAVFVLDVPYMYDAKKEMSGDIKVELQNDKGNGRYILKIIPDKKWLEAETREYPVVIDPVVSTALN